MNRAYLHLLLGQIPMTGNIFALALFMLGFNQNNTPMQVFALGAFVVLFLFTVLAFWSGYLARRELLRHPRYVTVRSERQLEKHMMYAQFLLMTMTAQGGAGFIGWMILLMGYPLPANLYFSLTGLGLLNIVLFIYTANSGYKIRHVEIQDTLFKPMKRKSYLPPVFGDSPEEFYETSLEHRIREDRSRILEKLTRQHMAWRTKI